MGWRITLSLIRPTPSSLSVFDGRGGPVVAAVGFGVPLSLLVLELDDGGSAGHFLLRRRGPRRLERGRVGGLGFREHALRFVGPAAVVLDDFVCDFGHRSTCGMKLRDDPEQLMAVGARAMSRAAVI
jgi:hypothetical protein